MNAIFEGILTNIVPVLIIVWLVYKQERREKAKAIFHNTMKWVETGGWK